jgi:methyl-accepting chemotaxis protein WspA
MRRGVDKVSLHILICPEPDCPDGKTMKRITNWYLNLSVKRRLIGFFCSALVLLSATAAGGIFGMSTSNHALSSVYTNQVLGLNAIYQVETVVDHIWDAITEANAATPSWEEVTRKIKASLDVMERHRSLLSEVTGSTASDANRERANDIYVIVDRLHGILSGLHSAAQQRDANRFSTVADDKFFPLADTVHDDTELLVREGLASAKREFEESQKRYYIIVSAFLVMIVIGIGAAGLAATILIRGVNRPLSMMMDSFSAVRRGDFTRRLTYDIHDEFEFLIEGYNGLADYIERLLAQIQKEGIQVTASVTQLAATSKEQEASASELAATCTEIAASSNQIAVTSGTLLDTMKGVAQVTASTAEAAGEGQKGIANIDVTMAGMEEDTGTIVSKLAVLSEKAGNIAGMVKLINRVADQTNLLSLNAAIEAEKAGEYGTGFSVVATEIRRLADQTAVATYDIEQTVQEVQTAVSSGVMAMDKFADSVRQSTSEVRQIGMKLTEVIHQVQSLAPHIKELNQGMESQFRGANQISEAISQLSESAQQAVESLAHTSEIINGLKDVASGLQKSVSIFKTTG